MAIAIKTIAQLRKFLAEPTCLECGYSMQGLADVGRKCPECGTLCSGVDLKQQLLDRPWMRLAGIDTLYRVSLGLFMGALLVPAIGAVFYWMTGPWTIFVAGALWLVIWIWSLGRAINEFGGAAGILLPVVGTISLVLVTVGSIGMVSWAMLVYDREIWHPLSREGLSLLGGSAVALAAAIGGSRIVARSCRRRIGAICEEWLAQSANPPVAVGNHTPGHPH